MLRRILVTIAISSNLAIAGAHAREPDRIPPATAQPLSQVVRVIEAEGHTVIPEIAFDEGVWNFRVYKAGLEYEIKVDPVSAEILSIRPK